MIYIIRQNDAWTVEKMKKYRYYTEKDSFGVEAAVILLALSVIFRVIGCWGLWRDQLFLLSQIVLPAASALLFILLLVLLGRVALWSTSLPLIMGVAFFILRAMTFGDTVKTVLCVVLYVLVAVLYCGTVFHVIPARWPLLLAFGLPLVYHIVFLDLPALNNLENPVSFAVGMQEMSVLSIMLALFFTATAIRKRAKDPEPELPKIKDPVVHAPEKPEEEAAPVLQEPESAADSEAPPEETGGGET